MNKQVKIFLSGLLVLIPFAVTVWLIWILAQWSGEMGFRLVSLIGPLRDALSGETWLWSVVGVLIVLAAIYLVGLLMSMVLFRRLFGWLDRVMNRLPGVNIIYQAIRDMVKLFDGSSKKMGKVVMYRPTGSQQEMLGILTNENPPGVNEPGKPRRVCVYVPFGLAIGGLLYYAAPEELREIDLPVEQAMKLSAMANVGGGADEDKPQAKAEK